MKRNSWFALGRGLELTVVNWPLLLVPIVETIVVLVVQTGTVAALAPLLVAAGLGGLAKAEPDLPTGGDLRLAITNHWPLILLMICIVIVDGLLEMAMHAFAQAGAAEVYIAADRGNARFASSRWFSGGKRGWRRVLGIYTIWLVVALMLLVPLVPIPFLSVGFGGGLAPCVLLIGCALLALWGCFAACVIVITFVWTLKAIVVAMARDRPSREALGYAVVSIGSNLGAHIAVALVITLTWFCGAMLLTSGFVRGLSAGNVTTAILFSSPTELALYLLPILFSDYVQSWFLASNAVLTEGS